MNLFAFEHTNRVIAGIEIPAGVMQSINPTFIVLLAPVMGALWVWLGDTDRAMQIAAVALAIPAGLWALMRRLRQAKR